MKRIICLLLLTVFAFFASVTLAPKASAEEIDKPLGKIVFHYQLWDQDYHDAGLWVWNTGTGGSQAPVTSSVTDDFGAVYEVNIGAGAADVGIIACRHEIGNDLRWNYRETADGYNFTVDPTPILDGTTEEMHVYYFQGGMKTYFVADNTKANILLLYYDPAAAYEENLGIHSWGNWAGIEAPGWASPLQIFEDGFKSPGDVQGKACMLSIDEADFASAGFLVYAGDDSSKKTPEQDTHLYLDASKVKNGTTRVLYVTGKEAIDGQENLSLFTDKAFKFDFQQFDATSIAGTYAADPKTIFAKFTLAVALKGVIGQKEVEKTRTVTKKFPVPGSSYTVYEPATPYEEYVETPVAEGMKAKVVVHYQRWDNNYETAGLWSWGAGTGGTSDGIEKAGVDSFGAVFNIDIAEDHSDNLGIITIAAEIDNDNRWNNKDGGDKLVDISGLAQGDVMHVYAFQGGNTVTFVGANDAANIFVLYLATDGVYEENLGFHTWNNWVGVENPEWGAPVKLFTDGFADPADQIGKVAHLKAVEGQINGGFLVYAGGDESKKTPTNASDSIEGLADLTNGSATVIYIYDNACYTSPKTFAENAFGEFVESDVEETYYEKEDVIGDLDFTKFFTVKQGEKELKIKQIDYNKSSGSTNEFVIILEDAIDNKLDTKLTFNNGLEGSAKLDAEITVDVDKEAPVITFAGDTTIKCIAGKDWEQSRFPIYRVTDDRDANLTSKVYVAKGKGTVNFGKPGTYPVTLEVVDNWGNVGEATFNIVVEATAAEGGCNSGALIISMITALGLVAFVLKRKH